MTEREGPCRAWIPASWIPIRCKMERAFMWHVDVNVPWFHPYRPRPTLREWLRDAALWLAPPGWVLTLGLLASIVALALLFFDMVPR